MDFLTLRIRNFLTIGDSGELALDGRGLVLLQGVNLDDPSAKSNGAGKSSIPDALCWALFGTTARGESGDAIVNKIAGKDCVVEVVVRDGDTHYQITRCRKHKMHKNSTFVYGSHISRPTDADWMKTRVELHKGTEKETQEVIHSILGCGYEVFTAAVYSGQDQMVDLPKLTDKQLKLLIEEAAGIERLSRAHEIARSKALDAGRDTAAKQDRLVRATSDIARLQVALRGQNQEHQLFEDGRVALKEAAMNEAAKNRGDIVRLHTVFVALKESEAKAELEEIAVKLKDHSKITAERDRILRESVRLDRETSVLKAEFDRVVSDAKRIKAQIDNAPAEMAKPCPECGKPHTEDELSEFVAHLSGRLKTKLEEASIGKKNLLEWQETRAAAEKAFADFSVTIPDVSELAKRQAELNKTLGDAALVRDAIHKSKAEFNRFTERADMVMTDPNPYTSAVALVRKQLEEAEYGEELAKDALALARSAQEIADACVRVFGPAGVRAQILDTVTPFLNDRTADYLSALSDGNITAVWSTLSETAKGELREKFNIDVQNTKGAESFGLLSGGEKRKVRISTMMALQDLVSARATKPINLFVADEVDDALDSNGLERLMGVMERKARERGTVLIISHNELRDWVDQTVTVTKEDGRARVEGVLSVGDA
jgi:DNA repair exonuclease SbcCD ATPase subunit